MKAKRTAFAEFQICDLPELDLEALKRDEVVEIRKPGILGFSALVPAHHRLTRADVDLLANLSATEWADVVDQDLDQVEVLARHGFVVVDVDEEPFAEFRQRDEAFTAGAWSPEAACFHFAAEDRYHYKQPDGNYEAALANAAESFTQRAEKYGPPPPAFWEPDQVAKREALPIIEPEGDLFDVLRARHSVRSYDKHQPLDRDQLATLLYAVFGCQGTTELAPCFTVLRKTSPSGGSIHPTEAYPLIRNVAGIEPGLYHYSSEHHALNLLEPMAPDDVGRLAIDCGHGQIYLGDAHLVVLLTSRWTRHLWKYRNISRAYTTMLMDAGFLSQTWYLVATQLGLGTCFTGAIDAPTIEHRLKLDGVTQGPVGILACGPPGIMTSKYGKAETSVVQFPAVPFTPRAR